PSPLWRVRSTTAPAGAARLLTGWSLQRQHAPWALVLGPLAALARAPRLSIDGFVVSPASWRVPLAVRDGQARPAALRRWRPAARCPPPREARPRPLWRSFRLHGPVDRQAELLVGVVAPALRAARRAGRLERWFFLRYAEAGGRRPHLRVRVQAPTPRALAAL